MEDMEGMSSYSDSYWPVLVTVGGTGTSGQNNRANFYQRKSDHCTGPDGPASAERTFSVDWSQSSARPNGAVHFLQFISK